MTVHEKSGTVTIPWPCCRRGPDDTFTLSLTRRQIELVHEGLRKLVVLVADDYQDPVAVKLADDIYRALNRQ